MSLRELKLAIENSLQQAQKEGWKQNMKLEKLDDFIKEKITKKKVAKKKLQP